MHKESSISYALILLHLSKHTLCQNKQEDSYSNLFLFLHGSI